jgi:myo-inositol-1(or 4)-monophosphatase
MQPTLSDLEMLARAAGDILRQGYNQRHQITYKGAIDLVTEMDHRSEAYLIDEIRRRFPKGRIITEESGSLSGEDCCVWYIDPLDGTVNYAHGVPFFSVSLAYAEAGLLRLGVVYDPLREECFCAEAGKGAWLNGETIQPSGARQLDQSLLVTGFPYDIRTNPRNNLVQYTRFALCSQGVRRLGSAALDLCYIASGRMDGYWELSLNQWDLAAGALIAVEAGALVTTVLGDKNVVNPPCSILAATPLVHPQMLSVLQELSQPA